MIAAIAALGVMLASVVATVPAAAFESPESASASPSTTSAGSATLTMRGSGITAKITATGLQANGSGTYIFGTTTLGNRGYVPTDFSPTLPTDSPAADIYTNATNNCGVSGLCPGLGTVTISFSRPVHNPILNIAGLGGSIFASPFGAQSNYHGVLTLTTPGVTMTKRGTGANLRVTPTTITAIEDNASINCANRSAGQLGTTAAKAVAACGSVQIDGTVTSLSFDLSAIFTVTKQGGHTCNTATGVDTPCSVVNVEGWLMNVVVPQDYGDAPVSYDAGNAARAVLSDLALGPNDGTNVAHAEEDNETVTQTATFVPTSPNASASAGIDSLDDGVTFGTLTTETLSYSTDVKITGASKDGYVCGWIDFLKNNVFDPAERACATFVAGATTAKLTWTIPPSPQMTAQQTYARFRIGYTEAQTNTPTGASDAGEVEDYLVTIVPADPQIELVKSAVGPPAGVPNKPGDVINYSFTATNTGNVPLTAVEITDPRLPANGVGVLVYTWPTGGTAGTLLPGDQVTATAPYVVTQDDIDAGTVLNTATVTGKPPISGVVRDSDSATVNLEQAPHLSLTKTAHAELVGTPAKIDDKITYTFEALNDGNVTLYNVTIDDPLLDPATFVHAWPGPVGRLLPGESVKMTAAPYLVTQADIDAEKVDNKATAKSTKGTDPTSPRVDSEPVTTHTPLAVDRELTLTKIANADGVGDPAAIGEVIEYTFAATNNGTTTLFNVKINDPLPRLSALVYDWPNTEGTLLPGETVTATATYELDQADLDAGAVDNVAQATSTTTTDSDSPKEDSNTADTHTPLNVERELTLTKIANADAVGSPSEVDDVIEYTFEAKNTGTTTLYNVSIDDPLPGLSPLEYAWTNTPGILLPGESVTATATYRVTQTDLDAGEVNNEAVAHSTTTTATDGPPITSNKANTHTPLEVVRELSLTKVADASEVAVPANVDDTITYTFVAKNEGTTTLYNVTIDDPLPGLSPLEFAWTNTPGILLPGESVTATATYRVTTDDIDAEKVDNEATATSTTTPDGDTPVGSNPASTHTPLTPPAPELVLTKTADATGVGAPTNVGDTITYQFEATNTGNMPLYNVTIDDPLPGLSALTYTWPTGGTPGTLLIGESVTATAAYVVTQSDIDTGKVDNEAVATSATAPDGGTPVDSDPAATHTPLTVAPALSLTKTADASAISTPTKVGQTITYHFEAMNTGNSTLYHVTIDDPMAGLSPLVYTWPTADEGTLRPGEWVMATATYQVTQADIDAGNVHNSATATSLTRPTRGVPVPSDPADTDTPVTPTPRPPFQDPADEPELSFVKTADASGLGLTSEVGETIVYHFSIKNTGNVAVTDVNVDDELAGLSEISYEWPGEAGVLEPGDTATATATYAVTQADLARGEVVNTADAHGSTIDIPDVASNESTVTTPTPVRPPLVVVDDVLAATGGTLAWGIPAAAGGMLLIGAVILMTRRRRNDRES